jgi:hypothetical protein
LSGSATANGIDAATVTFDGSAYTATVHDSYTDIASGWNQAEFNVFGNGDLSEAQFNNNVSISVNLGVTDGSTAAPTCLPPSSYSGTTGETNNLNLGSPCTAAGGTTPSIEFVETLGTPPTPGIVFSPSPVDFTTTEGTTSTSQIVTVKNETGVNLTNFILTDSDATSFLRTSTTCTSNFAYGASCTFNLACYSTTLGTVNGNIVGAGNGYSTTLPLSCIVNIPPYSGSESGQAPKQCLNYVGSYTVQANQVAANSLNWNLSGIDGATVIDITYSISDTSGTLASGTVSGDSGPITTSRLPVAAPKVSGNIVTTYNLPSGTGRCSIPYSFNTTN